MQAKKRFLNNLVYNINYFMFVPLNAITRRNSHKIQVP